jgi:ubiquinone biosynthesis monooxygenase Coq7
VTQRRAVAEARVRISPALAERIAHNTLAKGDLLAVARSAGIQAAKRTDELIPLCHSLPLDSVDVRAELRTDHAGETGAVMIYCGVLAVSRDPRLREFAQHHLDTERRHLALIEQVLPAQGRSKLLPLWRLSGWLTGALPACAGPRAVYATIQAVETFVDRHYADQVAQIDTLLSAAASARAPDAKPDQEDASALISLRALLEQCRLDEVAHRDDAASRWDRSSSGLIRLWQALVGRGSAWAVSLCRLL